MSNIQRYTPVMDNLRKPEQLVISARANKAIKDIPETDLIQGIKLLMEGIARDIGLRTYDEYDSIRMMDILGRYYSHWSLLDVKLAFELAMVGILDEFLPREKGEVRIEHYQQFSLSYVTKILKAYQQYRSQVVCKVEALLPEKATMSLEDRKKIEDRYNEDVISAFEAYRDELKDIQLTVTYPLMSILHKHGLLDAEVEATEAEIQSAFHEMKWNKRVHTSDKIREEDARKVGEIGPFTMSILRQTMDLKLIRLAFDKILEQEKHIKEYLYDGDND